MLEHIKECSKFPVTCPNSCGHSIPRDMVATHAKDVCPLTIISCPYAWVGCSVKVQRQEMESHLESTSTVHLDLVHIKLNNTEDELKNTKVELRKTKDELSETKDELERLRLSTIQHTNSFLWRIDGFSEILSRARTDEDENYIESDPFYTKTETGSYGYKLKISIYPNGARDGENNHLSVCIIVMKGNYDAILPWPFTKKVTITLIDQHEDPDQRQNKIHEIVGFDNECFARPVTGENSGSGCSEFISHLDLHWGPFIVDDTLFLKVDINDNCNFFSHDHFRIFSD
ncbi:TNF receptor-associated factor 4-like isoform X2 [Stylophora pistillata]|uniref:TNF receptor-associated factor 4-like isoform X2 n=1 Tax=Stylophora pistillata TaxID=50429 RepID=UPI000C044B6D|nr:TNF receptor-associated factor 4-like isoform X2 [Stylophora pistillata]XP_022803573.1 TNF receptor-associated factor 4-like isoform X2 [Stylophora pistillata]